MLPRRVQYGRASVRRYHCSVWDSLMQSLHLNSTILASRFPEPADVYVCDQCGRDITEHLHQGRPHVWRPLGPARYTCICGAKYITGALEWDTLSRWEKTNRLRQSIGLLLILGIILSLIVAVLYFAFTRGGVFLTVLAILAVIPAFLFLTLVAGTALDLLGIVSSIWRTRGARIWR